MATDTKYIEGHDIPEPMQMKTWKDYIKLLFGPGIIALGLGLGTGELISAPYLVVKMGPGLLWIATISILLQTLTSVIATKYTVLTGETVQIGINRLWLGKKVWTFLWVFMGILTRAWPYYMALTGSTLAALFIGQIPGADQRGLWTIMSILGLVLCMIPLFVGKKVMSTLATLFFWLTAVVIIPLLGILAIKFVPGSVFGEAFRGFLNFGNIPPNADWTALAAVAGYAGLASNAGMSISSYYRDAGWGMAKKVGYIASATGEKTELQTSGYMPPETDENASRLKKWTNYTKLELVPIFFFGSIITMTFPCVLYYHFVPASAATESGFGFTALLAHYMSDVFPAAWTVLLVAFLLTFWLDGVAVTDGGPRDFANIIWNAYPELKDKFKGDVRPLYYGILVIFVVLWLIMIAIGTTPHVMALMSGAFSNLIGFIFPIGLLGVNFVLLPKKFRFSWFEVAVLVCAVAFYGFFFINFLRNSIF